MRTQTVTPEDTQPPVAGRHTNGDHASDNELDEKALMQLKIASFSIE